MTSSGFSGSLRVLVTSVVSLVSFVSFRTLVSFYCFGFKYMLDEALVPRYKFQIDVQSLYPFIYHFKKVPLSLTSFRTLHPF